MFTESLRGSGPLRSLRWLALGLLALWAAASFGVIYFARDLSFMWGPWPFSFWLTAQGSVLVFLVITVVYASVANRLDKASNVQDVFTDDEHPPESDERHANPDR